MKRHLWLVAYDTDSARIRYRIRRWLQAHAMGRQKSVYECWLDGAAHRRLLARLAKRIPGDRACWFMLRLDPRARVICLGRSSAPRLPALIRVD